MGIAVYAEPQYGRYPGAYPSGYPTGYPTGYPMGYPASFIPGFRKYPAVARKPQPASPNGRIFFLESTVFTTSTSTSSITCTYSTAALAACTGRKRRGILIDEEKETIAPSGVLSIIPTEEAKLEDLREKPDVLQDSICNQHVNSNYIHNGQLFSYLCTQHGHHLRYMLITRNSVEMTSRNSATPSKLFN